MKKTLLTTAVAVAALLICSGVYAADVAKVSLLVLPIQPNGVPQEVANSLGDLMLLELEKTNLYNVVGQEDIKALMRNEEVKQLMGTDSEEAMAKIGAKLSAEYLLRSTLGKVGNTYLLALTLLDVKNVKVVRRVNQSLYGDPDDLIGSLKSAVAALALEESGYAPSLTEQLIEGLNIGQKTKHWFFGANIGYELPVGPMTDQNDLAYMLPDLFNVNLSIQYQMLPYMRIVGETGAAFSIMQQFAMQTKQKYMSHVDGEMMSSDPTKEKWTDNTIVSTSTMKFSSLRIPFALMVKFMPSSGRLLPYFMGGLGFSYQRYSFGDESYQRLDNSKGDGTSNPVCQWPYVANGKYCILSGTMKPSKINVDTAKNTIAGTTSESSLDYFNLNVPLAIGFEYLLYQNFGFGLEARYLLTASLNKKAEEMIATFYEKKVGTNADNKAVTQYIGDAIPVRQYHHGISVMGGVLFYF